jgi:hypothetical protein
MLFDILQTITDFVVLLTRLTTEDLADEQRMALIDQYLHLHGLEAADLHDLQMILITVLITIFWRAWDRTDRWPFRCFRCARMISDDARFSALSRVTDAWLADAWLVSRIVSKRSVS